MYNEFRRKMPMSLAKKTFTEKEIRQLKANPYTYPTRFNLLLNSRKSSGKDISPGNPHYASLRNWATIPMCLGKSVLMESGSISKMKSQSLVNFIPDILLHVRLLIPNS